MGKNATKPQGWNSEGCAIIAVHRHEGLGTTTLIGSVRPTFDYESTFDKTIEAISKKPGRHSVSVDVIPGTQQGRPLCQATSRTVRVGR